MFILKFILIIVLAAGGYYGYKNHYSEAPTETSIAGRINSGGPVTAREIQVEAKKLAKFICNDDQFQESIGSSALACQETYANYESMCDRRVFPDGDKIIGDTVSAKGLISRYRKCSTKI